MTVTTLLAASLPATPSLPPSTVPDVDVTPGVWGFIAIAAVAVATIALVVDMTRRIRLTRYRAEVRERLEAEARGEVAPPEDGALRDGDDLRGLDDTGRADVGDDTERG